MTRSPDPAALSYWYPRINGAGLPCPDTEIVRTPFGCDLSLLLDGSKPECFDPFIRDLEKAGEAIGYPCFLRTGHGSGKHDWKDTCLIESKEDLPTHVTNLVEWSHLVDIAGLPHDEWAVRHLLPTETLFHAFNGLMPITREFRVFVEENGSHHFQPYWPPDAIWAADQPDWRERLEEASKFTVGELTQLRDLATRAVEAVGQREGGWSVDLLQSRDENWWITDMAPGELSFRWKP